MSASAGPTLALLRSAFGPGSTLYTALQCTPSSTRQELKRAYRKAALRYHPDRVRREDDRNDDDGGVGEARGGSSPSNLKFQAVSASYQILMDEKRKSIYDATGQILEDEDDVPCRCDNDESGASRAPFSKGKANATKGSHRDPRGKNRQWEQLFQSIFDEIISTGADHAKTACSYRGSEGEREDVLYYYKMCKGDIKKVVECMVHGSAEDVVRWKREIVRPAVERGEVDDYGGEKARPKPPSSSKKRRTILEDESSSDEEIGKTKSSVKSQRRRGRGKGNKSSFLVDTDDEEEEGASSPHRRPIDASNTKGTASTIGMSKRDKMDFRVAKKRKAKAAKEMEIADIIQSKNWDVGGAAKHRSRQKEKNMGGISDALLENMEKRYGSNGKKRKKR